MLNFDMPKLLESLDYLQYSIYAVSSETLRKHVEYIKNETELFGLKVSNSKASDVIDMLDENEPLDGDEMPRAIDSLIETLTVESKNINLVAISRIYHDYKNSKTFNDIRNNFPSDDIESIESNFINAAKCFAIEQYLGCLFNLMNVIEIALSSFTKEVGVCIDTNRSWGEKLKKIETAVGEMSDDRAEDKKKKDYYRELIKKFNFIKDEWRNPIIHESNEYTKEETQRIFSHVEGFMKDIASSMYFIS